MSAISGSMVEPSKIFSIINSTGEYPNISKEFTKLINETHVYGYNLVSAMRNLAFNSPSSKLAELFNGLASTISSGGDIQDFFEKRAQSLLFEYKIENEKHTKTAETFMDIYISVVIAAPMIFYARIDDDENKWIRNFIKYINDWCYNGLRGSSNKRDLPDIFTLKKNQVNNMKKIYWIGFTFSLIVVILSLFLIGTNFLFCSWDWSFIGDYSICNFNYL